VVLDPGVLSVLLRSGEHHCFFQGLLGLLAESELAVLVGVLEALLGPLLVLCELFAGQFSVCLGIEHVDNVGRVLIVVHSATEGVVSRRGINIKSPADIVQWQVEFGPQEALGQHYARGDLARVDEVD